MPPGHAPLTGDMPRRHVILELILIEQTKTHSTLNHEIHPLSLKNKKDQTGNESDWVDLLYI